MAFNNLEFSDIKIDKVFINKVGIFFSYLFVFLLALFLAKIIDSTIRNFLLDSMSNLKPIRYSASNYKSSKTYDSLNKYSNIMKINVFNVDTELPKREFNETASTTGSMRKTSLDIDLVGTIVLSEPSRSVAAIKVKTDVEPFIIGDILNDTVKIVSIADKRVIFSVLSSGDLEYLDMDEDTNEQTAMKGGIRKIDDDNIIMDKGYLNRQLNNMNQLLLQARAVPHMVDGEVAGFKLLGIKKNSLYDKLGAKNGDIIKSVNGIAVDSPTVAMQIYHQLRSGKEFNIEIDRKDEIKSINIQVR